VDGINLAWCGLFDYQTRGPDLQGFGGVQRFERVVILFKNSDGFAAEVVKLDPFADLGSIAGSAL
jgi:hypothetical protein